VHQEDEIDLFELFSALWEGRWSIIALTLIAVLFGGAYAVYKERNHVFSYKSTIAFTAHNLPPFYDANHAFSDLSRLFRSEPQFKAWRTSNSKAIIDFAPISPTQLVDGVELASSSSLVSLDANGLGVNTNDLQVLDGLHSYLMFLNESLTRQYIERTVDEINYIERRFKDFWIADVPLQEQVLTFMQHTNEVRKLESYVERAEGGAHVFKISRPTQPVVTSASPKTNLIVALSIVLGGFVGAAYVLLRNTIRRRRETLSAS